MNNLEFTNGALADLEDIWRYTLETWGNAQAERYIETLEDACYSIAANTARTRPFPAHDGVSGCCHCEHHYIFYRRDDERTVILAVLHERMDLIARVQDRL